MTVLGYKTKPTKQNGLDHKDLRALGSGVKKYFPAQILRRFPKDKSDDKSGSGWTWEEDDDSHLLRPSQATWDPDASEDLVQPSSQGVRVTPTSL